MALSRNNLNALLEELAEMLILEDCAPVEWVVCGGAALSLQDLSMRPTADVDVVGAWNERLMTVESIEGLPDKVRECIRAVYGRHPELAGLAESWINLGPYKLAAYGLPEGHVERMATLKFRDTLTLHLLAREDLIALKLYAASDRFGKRREVHFGDLVALSPTFQELDKAVEWVRTLPDFPEKQMELKDVVRRLDYEGLAYYI